MITACLFALATHSLLNDDPAAFIGDDEAVQIKIKAVLHGGAVNLGDEAAHGGEFVAIKADAISDRHKLPRRAARVIAAPAADMQTEFGAERTQSALERAQHAGGDARGMPVHSHQRAKRLKPEGMGQPAQKFVTPVVMNDGFGQYRAKPRHAVGQPFRHMAVMERQIGASGFSHPRGSAFPANIVFLFCSQRAKSQCECDRASGFSQFSVRLLSLELSEKAGISMSKCSPLALTIP